jgi:hypothetical protein
VPTAIPEIGGSIPEIGGIGCSSDWWSFARSDGAGAFLSKILKNWAKQNLGARLLRKGRSVTQAVSAPFNGAGLRHVTNHLVEVIS